MEGEGGLSGSDPPDMLGGGINMRPSLDEGEASKEATLSPEEDDASKQSALRGEYNVSTNVGHEGRQDQNTDTVMCAVSDGQRGESPW